MKPSFENLVQLQRLYNQLIFLLKLFFALNTKMDLKKLAFFYKIWNLIDSEKMSHVLHKANTMKAERSLLKNNRAPLA